MAKPSSQGASEGLHCRTVRLTFLSQWANLHITCESGGQRQGARYAFLMPDANPNTTEVYAIHGADPEVLAYAMAKYSRSALTLRESLKEISAQRAEQFLNTFYFQYGHRSIADLAHVAFAVERLSLLAAIALVDEPRWDGQERSTRYQDFRKSGFYTPAFARAEETALYRDTAQALFDGYQAVGAGMLDELKQCTPRPTAMDPGAYERTLKARAFDMARYLLPLGTNTSLGQISNARTLEGQISRLLGSDYAEVRELGEKLREAAAGVAWSPGTAAAEALVHRAAAVDAGVGEDLREHLLRDVHVSPTLVKYTAPSEFARESRNALTEAVDALMGNSAIEPMPAEAPNVELIEGHAGERLSLEIDLATSLLYTCTHFRYAQIREAVAALPEARVLELVRLGTAHRGRHDELPRAYAAAGGLRFDILMDVGGFRDMHRHRRCTQLLQGYTTLHGFDVPDFPGQPAVSESRVAGVYAAAIERAQAAHARLRGETASSEPALDAYSTAPVPVPQFAQGGLQMQWGTPLPDTTAKRHGAPPQGHAADYLLPLATRCRSMFSMDFAQAVYITELRSTPAGHWSYRNVAWQMFQAVARQHPGLASHFRVADPRTPIDLLQR